MAGRLILLAALFVSASPDPRSWHRFESDPAQVTYGVTSQGDSPVLLVGSCGPGGPEFYVRLGSASSADGDVAVGVRIDRRSVATAPWHRSGDGLFADDPRAMADRLRRARVLELDVPGSGRLRFNVAGFSGPLRALRKACRPDSGTSRG